MENTQEIKRVTREAPEYPGRLRRIPDPPKCLYVKGRLPDDNRPSVAMIGARDCSAYGRSVALWLGKRLGEAGVQVISGMARGIDGIGQEAALDAGGSSFGVLGCGVDICYPAQNRRLYEKLCAAGGILSEYEPGTPPKSWNFPPRNRIVSGLADIVVVVEARVKSGTFITVDMALEQGKEVYVVPGRITDSLSTGCNQLIKMGAGILLDVEEFLEELWELHNCGKTEVEKPGRKEKTAEDEAADRTGNAAAGDEAAGRAGNAAAEDEAAGRAGNAAAEEETADGKETNATGGAAVSGNQRKRLMKGKPVWERMEKELKEETERGISRGNAAGDGPSSFPALSPECAAILGALDFYPQSMEQIQKKLPPNYQGRMLSTGLIRLCMEGAAVQVSPGYFCSSGA